MFNLHESLFCYPTFYALRFEARVDKQDKNKKNVGSNTIIYLIKKKIESIKNKRMN